MIDNLELIKPLLNFEKEGDFYMLYILKRKKDQTTDKANHQSVRTVKSYCVESVEYLEKRYEEIQQLCEIFKARAYIYVQKQNHYDVSLELMIALANKIRNGQHKQQHLFDSVVGQVRTLEKRWIVDIDTKDPITILKIKGVIDNVCRPEGVKTIDLIPTKNGFHYITERFDVLEFKKHFPEVDIQKRNPTLLYYPNSLDNL
jgi:hypothetical protein